MDSDGDIYNAAATGPAILQAAASTAAAGIGIDFESSLVNGSLFTNDSFGNYTTDNCTNPAEMYEVRKLLHRGQIYIFSSRPN